MLLLINFPLKRLDRFQQERGEGHLFLFIWVFEELLEINYFYYISFSSVSNIFLITEL